MVRQGEAGRTRGIERVWRLTADGYRIVDVDSDDVFVGIRMERGGETVTLLLTRDDFADLFPGAEVGDKRGARRVRADRP